MTTNNGVLVYSTDSLEHKENMGVLYDDEVVPLGMYEDADGKLHIKEELMWDGSFEEDEGVYSRWHFKS